MLLRLINNRYNEEDVVNLGEGFFPRQADISV